MQVRIYSPVKNAMQSGRAKSGQWLVEFEPSAPKDVDPLMGWVGSRDTRGQLKLSFKSKEEAIAYAQREGYDYRVFEQLQRRVKPKSYADNFRFDKVR